MTDLAVAFDAPYYEGFAVASDVPKTYPVALAGRGFLVDDTFESGFTDEFLPLLRPQADTSTTLGEQSLSPDGLWRRSQDSWHHGAGQRYLDRPESDPFRFRASKGVEVFDRWGLRLLHEAARRRQSTAPNLALLPVGAYLYVADGNEVWWTQDVTAAVPAWTASGIQAGEAAQAVKSIATDGKTVYAALGSNGVHTSDRGAAVSAHFNPLSCTLIAYVNGRLMAANGNAVYNIVSGAAPAALFTHPNTDFKWVGFAAGVGHIYAAGFSGDKSLIYRTAVKADGTALETPVLAAPQLPDGEVVHSIFGYLGFILLGTSEGVRFCLAEESTGNLRVGTAVPYPAPVRCFEGQGRFAWFGMTNYDTTSSGLGRLDLTTDTGGGTVPLPAYASDLMAAAQGDVVSVATFQRRRVFAVAGSGVWVEQDALVPAGTLDSGLITFGIPDKKVAVFVDLRHRPLDGEHGAYLAADEGDFMNLGSHGTPDSTAALLFQATQSVGEVFEVRQELKRSDAAPDAGPEITRLTLLAYPTPTSGEVFVVPLIISEQYDSDGLDVRRDPEDDLAFIRSLVRRPVPYQRGGTASTVFVERFKFFRHQRTQSGRSWAGVCVVQLKSLAEAPQ